MKKKPVTPVKEIDLRKLTVFQLIEMLERGETEARYVMMTLKAAEQRGFQQQPQDKHPHHD